MEHMAELRVRLREKQFATVSGMLLAFNSGFINACCVAGFAVGMPDQPVAGVTGAYTRAAMGVYDPLYQAALVACFVAGSAVTSLINPRPAAYRLTPHYGPTFLIGAALLSAAHLVPPSRGVYLLVVTANGVQNGVSSLYSANLIRTSHMTGSSTDVGVVLGQLVRGNWTDLWKLCVLLGLASAFSLGSLVSCAVVATMHRSALICSAALFTLIGVGCIAFGETPTAEQATPDYSHL
jgi:uncharacterized membrane protein YoaK (UPF0700 family)